MNKRIISLLLALVMALGMFPVTAMAEETVCDHAGAMQSIVCNEDGTHTRSVACACGEVSETAETEDCFDEDDDGLCDVCLTELAEEAPAAVLLSETDNGTGDPNCDHILMEVEAKEPTPNSVGWEAYVRCLKCGYNTYVEIPMLEANFIDNYEEFLFYLQMLEELAWSYAMENPGKDPLALTLKYIRTGVERYNSGSWGIMAGYEDPDFAEFVVMMEEMLNEELVAAGEEPFVKVTGLKNLYAFELPNGELCDIGHIFGMMDITYHNNFSTDHADVAGWGGDMIDLLEFADRGGVSGSLSEMVAQIGESYLGVTPPDGQVGFNQLDVNGDLDGFYFMDTMKDMEYEMYGLAMLMEAYYTEDLTEEDRADYFLHNRLDGVSVRSDVRDAVYQAILRNNVVATLEGTRDFYTDDLDGLRKACCYAFADYLCRLAGDYVEENENRYFEVFNALSTVLAPGITQDIKYATTADGLQTVYYIATADITRDDVHLFANYNNNDPAEGWAMQRVEDQANAAQAKYGDPDSPFYIENYNVIASTNGAGFNMQTGEPGGVLVMGGVEYHEPNSNGFIGVLDDGTAVIGTTEEYNTIYKGRVQEAIAVFGDILVRDGKVVVPHDDDHVDKRASRTAAGITKTGKVVLMVMDGRQLPFSCGGSMQEIAQVMLEAGCVHAVNLDGGGSTTYVAKQPGEEALSVVNNPSDGVARSVSTSLMLVSTAPSSTAFDHAILETSADYVTIGTELQISPVGISATGNAAELPEGTTWAVSDERWGTITEDGVFTGLRNGDVDVYLMLGEEIIGSKTIHVVIPNQVYFTKASVSAVYGQTISLPVKALYDSKTVAVQASDLVFSLSNANAGTIDGFTFTGKEKTGIKNVQITVALAADASKTASLSVSLYEQGEATFDFDRATGGDRQLAWDRKVSNAVEETTGVYTVVDPAQDMVTSYILAIDMTQIPIPAVLEDLTYMLPGSDIEGASAWTFLCQLAERVSVLSEVRPTVTFDPNFDVDISGMKLVNDYFALTASELDEETNTVTLTLNWIDQTHALDASMANPLCIVSGIKLTPKEDAQWSDKGRLNVVNSGEIGYKICLRASALYSFAQKPENQKTFQLFPFVNPNDESEKGGYFESIYKTFTDSYTLVNQLKNGWYRELGGFTYYVDGEMLTGIQQIDGYYYDLGEKGVSPDQSKYTGIVEIDGVKNYCSFGELTAAWQTVTAPDGTQTHYYYGPEMYTGVRKIGGFTYTFGEDGVLLRGEFVTYGENTKYYWAGGRPITRRWVHLEEGSYWVDHYGNVAFGYFPVQESTTTLVWHHFDEKTGVLLEVCDGFFETDGSLYYCEDGETYYGAVDTGDGLVFCGTMGKVVVNGSCYIGSDVDYTAGLEYGHYYCGKDGYIQKDGFAKVNGNTYYFTDYVRAKGFTKVGEDYYFFNAANGSMMTGTLWISGSNPYGMEGGYYTFQEDGKMYIPDPNGEKAIVKRGDALYFTVDGMDQKNGLNELDGEYYYATNTGKLAVSTNVWISSFNDLIAPGSGWFAFDAEGKLIRTGFVTGGGLTYYYQDLVKAKGFTKVGEDYYFFNQGSGSMMTGTLWISGSNAYGVAEGYYTFMADGKMYIPDPNGAKAIVERNGSLYFTIDGVDQKNGLNELDGEYYYATSSGKLAVSTNMWLSSFNDLIAPGAGWFAFDADGRLVKTGFAAGGGYTYYYIDLVRAKGLTKIGEDFYFFNKGSGSMMTGNLWIDSNAYGVSVGTHTFGADGKMVAQ
ncbi:MAG: phosphodiester glycosidase family protein [Oscillospiraceae bacterium]|nr:phosphodiester glycosidase family protein [Oscillospiraceae bacterium]